MNFYPTTSADASIGYLDLGRADQPVHVYLGGLGSAGTVDFAPVVGHAQWLGRGRHLLVDVIGSGWSDHDDCFGHAIDQHAETVISLLENLLLREVTLVGHSFGGSTAISIAAQRPDLIARLVVAEPNLDPGVGTLSANIAAVDEDVFAATEHARIVADLLATATSGDVVAAQSARTLRRWSSRGLHRSAVSLLAARPSTFREQLSAFAGPSHYISGALSQEDLGPIREAGCRVHVVEDAGHVMMWDNFDGFVAALNAT